MDKPDVQASSLQFPPTVLRPEVQAFAQLMEQVLRENDWKGGWQGMTADEILERVREEVEELEDAVANGGFKDDLINKEAADIANFVMFLVDNRSREHRSDLWRLHGAA